MNLGYLDEHYEASTHTHTQTFGASFASSGVPLAAAVAAPGVPSVSQHLHGRVEVVLSEVSLKTHTDVS